MDERSDPERNHDTWVCAEQGDVYEWKSSFKVQDQRPSAGEHFEEKFLSCEVNVHLIHLMLFFRPV